MSALVQKICSICQTDVSQLKRTKDEQGNYFCVSCWQARVRAVADDDHSHRGLQSPPFASSPGLSQELEPEEALPVLSVAAPTTKVQPSESLPRTSRVSGSVRAWLSLAFYMLALMLGTIGLVFGGDLLVYIKEQHDAGAATLILFVPICALYLMPFIILWTVVKSATVIARSQNSFLRAIVATVALAAVVIGIAGYSRYRGITSLFGSKPSDTSFVDFDSQFGAGIIGNPSLLSKTGEQAQESLKQYMGRMVSWKGVVLDVRDGQVLIQHRSFMGTNEVALLLGWWDEATLKLLNKGDVVEYTGVISGVGDPYPYTLTSGTIKSHHTASEDEQSQLLKDNDKSVLDQMYDKK